MISIVFSCFNEANNDFFKQALIEYTRLNHVELICVDGHSTDATRTMIQNYPVRLYTLPNSSRAARYNLGVQQAKGDFIILHHPRSILELHGIHYLHTLNSQNLVWGGFTHRFDQKNIFYQFTSWYSNTIRFKLKNIVYLDHCIFLSKNLCQTMPLLQNVKIFEDTLLSKKLRKISKPKLLPFQSITSDIRFKKNGFLKQAVLNQVAKLLFWCKVNPNIIDALYEKNLSLNSKKNCYDNTLVK